MHASDTRPLTLDRRRFLQVTAGAGVAAAAGLGLAGCAGKPREREPEAAPEPRRGNPVEAIVDPSTGSVEVNEDVIVRYSACLGCYSSCGNRVHIDRATGKMFGVGGNPYNPNNAYPYLDHTEPLESAYRSMSLAAGGQNVHGALCGRGNGTWDAYRQPDRITVPLKRAGKRGEGKWKPIGWDQLIEELCEGGKLFADLGEDREIEGFRALHDTSTPLDPDAPELGPVANQLVMLGSRGDGRSGVGSRFSSAFGTKNNIGHGATCGGSENAGFYAIEESYRALCADFTESEYVICCGMFPGANGKSMQGIAHWASAALAAGTAKIDIVDPALGNGVATAAMENVRWLPITTATNAAFGMALIRIIIENGTYNETALSFPSQEAAVAGGYAAFSNASYLVVEDEGHERYRMFLRAEDAGMETPAPGGDNDKKKDYFVVIDASAVQPALHTVCQQAAIDYEGEVNGVRVRSAFSLLKESVLERTVEEYAAICGVPVEELERMAAEFTSHGTKAAFCGLFGGSAQANGSDATFIYPIMNALIGSNNMRGGMVPRRESGDAFGVGRIHRAHGRGVGRHLRIQAPRRNRGEPPTEAAVVSRDGFRRQPGHLLHRECLSLPGEDHVHLDGHAPASVVGCPARAHHGRAKRRRRGTARRHLRRGDGRIGTAIRLRHPRYHALRKLGRAYAGRLLERQRQHGALAGG